MIAYITLQCVFFVLVIIIALNCIVNKEFAAIPKITQVWKTKPIVSIYVSDADQGGFCKSGYEPVLIADDFSHASVSEGPCACVQNSLSLQSTNAKCPSDLHESKLCTSMSALPAIPSVTYRGASICIKRGGVPAATYRKEKYRSRPHPDYYDKCSAGYKSCGSICFPIHSQCPITSIMLLPANESVPDGQRWESAGTFSESKMLYVRRDQPHELPIVDIVARLSENTSVSVSARGQCYKGSVQVLNKPLVSDPNHVWSFTIEMPPVCEVVDPRYHLVDSVHLESHFLQNLQSAEPTCRAQKLYSLSDPRYQLVVDPDYLNSGVKCGADARLPCLRDPYQRTDCAAGDDICDGVVNQNTCGAYTHAVRSAFSGSSATMGLYFAREIEWSAQCMVSKEFVFQEASSTFYNISWLYFLFLCFSAVQSTKYIDNMLDKQDCYGLSIWLASSVVWLLLVRRRMKAIETSMCTDPFTNDVLFSDFPTRIAKCVFLSVVAIILLLCISRVVPVRTLESHWWPRPVPPNTTLPYPRRRDLNSATTTTTTTVTATATSTTTTTATSVSTTRTAPAATAPAVPTTGSVVTTPVTTAPIHNQSVAVQMMPMGRGGYEPLSQTEDMV